MLYKKKSDRTAGGTSAETRQLKEEIDFKMSVMYMQKLMMWEMRNVIE